MRGRNGGEAGKHDEGYQRRKQRQGDGGYPERPRDPSRGRRGGSGQQFGGRGLADAGHRLVSSRTGTCNSAWRYDRLGAPADRWCSISDAFLQQCCRIATIPGREKLPCGRSAPQQESACKRNLKNGSAAAAEDLDLEIADFLTQRIAIDPEQVRRADLVAACGRQRHREQRVLDLAQDAMVEPRRWQRVAEGGEVRRQVAFNRDRKALLGPRLVGAG